MVSVRLAGGVHVGDMINVNLINGEKMQVEGARIHIVGYEQFAFYAVPRVRGDFTIAEDQWEVVEETSGLCMSDEKDNCRTIDAAVESATKLLKTHAPPEKLAVAIKSRVDALKGYHLHFPRTAHRIAPTGGHPYN